MSATKISELTSHTTTDNTDVVPIVDTLTTTTKKITWSNIKANLKTYFDTLYGPGTVTSVSVVSANGLAGTVATATTTPAITLSTSITGVLKGNGTAISAASAGTDYTSPTGTENLQNKTLDNTNTVTVKDTLFTLQDDADTTKQAQFQLTNITTGTTRTYTFPNSSATLAILSGTQTFSGQTTFSNATVTVGTATTTATYGLGTGVMATGNTKTINIGTSGASGSTTAITIGSSTGGATTTVDSYGAWTHNSTLSLGTSNALTAGSIELGHASDTTLTRVSAGVAAIEGNNILTTATGLALSGGTMTGSITLAENAGIALDPAGSADGKWTGITVTGTAGYTQAFGDLVYLDPTDSRWEAADANSASGADGDSRGLLGMVVSAGTDGTSCTILLEGIIRADAKFPTFTVNNPIYVSETAGSVTQTQPTTTDVVIRIVGAALTTDEMFFRPDWTWATHT